MNPPSITHEEWIKELHAITNIHKDSPGLTSREIADRMGCCVDVAMKRLRCAKDIGVLQVGKRFVEGLDGRRQVTPVYWIETRKSGKRR